MRTMPVPVCHKCLTCFLGVANWTFTFSVGKKGEKKNKEQPSGSMCSRSGLWGTSLKADFFLKPIQLLALLVDTPLTGRPVHPSLSPCAAVLVVLAGIVWLKYFLSLDGKRCSKHISWWFSLPSAHSATISCGMVINSSNYWRIFKWQDEELRYAELLFKWLLLCKSKNIMWRH